MWCFLDRIVGHRLTWLCDRALAEYERAHPVQMLDLSDLKAQLGAIDAVYNFEAEFNAGSIQLGDLTSATLNDPDGPQEPSAGGPASETSAADENVLGPAGSHESSGGAL